MPITDLSEEQLLCEQKKTVAPILCIIGSSTNSVLRIGSEQYCTQSGLSGVVVCIQFLVCSSQSLTKEISLAGTIGISLVTVMALRAHNLIDKRRERDS